VLYKQVILTIEEIRKLVDGYYDNVRTDALVGP
jgi:hypothetical protein